MHASQMPSRAKAIASAVALWLFVSLVLGAALGLIGSLILDEHNLGVAFTSFGLLPSLLALTSSQPKASLKRPAWKIVLPLLGFYLIVVISFFWNLPLASNLAGLFLMLLIIAIIAQRLQFSSVPGWLLALGCGLAGGAGAALVSWLILGPGMISLSLMELLVESTALAGLVGWMLRQALDHFWPHMNQGQAAAMPAQAPAARATLSRRHVLQGLGGLASLAVTGVGFASLSRSLLAHVVPLVTYKSLGQVESISWSPDSKRIVSASTLGVAIWDAATGGNIFGPNAEIAPGYEGMEPAVWSPDRKRIAMRVFAYDGVVENSDQNVVIIDAVTMRSLVTLSAGKSGASSEDLAIAWSPDGARLATALGEPQVWDAATGEMLLILNGAASILAWSPDGRYLVTDHTEDNQVQVWDAASGALFTTYDEHTNFIQAVAWSPDSAKVASASFDGTVQVWDAQSGKRLLTYRGDPYGVNAVAWSPDGKHIASGGINQDVQVWNAATGEVVFLYKGHLQRGARKPCAFKPGMNGPPAFRFCLSGREEVS